jgi:Zn-dependent protease
LEDILYAISVWALPVLVAITLHEAGHGFVAWRLGDDTAWRLGRVSLNPLRHVDPFGTIILPAMLLLLRAPFLFGYAKPVPVNFARLRHPKRDMVWVALAGPGSNLLLAVISALLLHAARAVPGTTGDWLGQNLSNSLLINLVLAVFNMLPLPPLDGGRVAVGLLPRALAAPLARLERFGLGILLLLIFIVPMISAEFGHPFSPLAWVVGAPVRFLLNAIATVTGLR